MVSPMTTKSERLNKVYDIIINVAAIVFVWFALLMAVCGGTGCATSAPLERLHPTEDQMGQGAQQCRALCSSYSRDFREYRSDGKCVCETK